MKTRTWQTKKFRIVERSSVYPPKEGTTTYDIQKKNIIYGVRLRKI